MREIKFRAWDKVNLVMIPFTDNWICEEYSSTSFSAPEGHEWSGIGALPGSYGKLADGQNITEQYYLMQYTGLKDKNGKEIFSDDILEWRKDRETIKRVYVRWNDAFGSWILPHESSDRKNITPQDHISTDWNVIGNIYENPELLNK